MQVVSDYLKYDAKPHVKILTDDKHVYKLHTKPQVEKSLWCQIHVLKNSAKTTKKLVLNHHLDLFA